jgi:uncharacterized protein YcfJ
MSLVSSSIPNLINGISQQPAALRLASQAEQVVNCMPSPVEGLKKRPPCNHIGKLFSGSSGSGRPFVDIVDRDGTIKYLTIIRDNAIQVFGLDGTVKTVNTPDGTSYLDIGNTADPSATFRVASIADYTFIVNREKTVTMLTGGGDLSPVWGTKGMVFIKTAEYDTTYSIKVNSTTVTYATAATGGAVPSTVTIASSLASELATSAINSVAATLTCNSSGTTTTANFASTAGVVNGQYLTDSANRIPKGARVTNVTATTVTFSPAASGTIQNNDVVTFRNATYVVQASDYIVRIEKADGADYTLSSTDTRLSTATSAIKGTVDSLSDLPTIAEHGFLVKLLGSKATGLDDYYVKFETNAGSGFGAGVWRETVAPGIAYKFDPTTMPHVLVRESNGTFTFKKFDWAPRVAGDTTTAPNPSFVGSKIQNINLFRNRLVFLADENVILSATDSYDRFWPETVQTVVDSDPIDLTTGGTQINFLVSSLTFANTLLLFSRHGQFRLDTGATASGTSLTPKTASITQMTTFEMVDSVDPVGVGRTVYFAIPKGEFSGLREFFLPDASGPVPISEEVTASVPRFITQNLASLIASVSEESILLISKDQPKRVYLYKFFFQDDTKLQSSWSYWEVAGSKAILGADMLDSDLYLIVQYADGVYLEKVVMRPENIDTGAPIELLVDRKASEATCSVALTTPAGLDVQSTITLPYPINAGSTMVVVGRYTTPNTLQPGQVVYPLSQTATGGAGGNGTLTVRGDLTAAKFFVGELYEMLYEFSTQYLKEEPPGGGMSVAAGPKLQLRTWSLIFDQTSHFKLRVTPRGRDVFTYPYNGIMPGDPLIPLGSPGLRTDKFRVPVMAQNIDARIEIVSDSPLPCRVQSAEWEGWYHSRARRL